MITENLTDQEKELIEKVAEDGTSVGNVTLIRELKWPESQFWDVRNKLLEKGLLRTGRGRGGSVRRIVAATSQSGSQAGGSVILPSEIVRLNEEAKIAQSSESALYNPVAGVLREKWTKDYRVDDFVLDITAKQGRRDTGGTWSRPDIVMVSVGTLPFVPGKHLDVITFEIKPSTQLDVTSVYEALAHLRAATRAFVFLHVTADMRNDAESALENIFEECNRHGIGLIVAEIPADYSTWDLRVEAIRRETDPVRLNDFIAQQLSFDSKQKIQKWCR